MLIKEMRGRRGKSDEEDVDTGYGQVMAGVAKDVLTGLAFGGVGRGVIRAGMGIAAWAAENAARRRELEEKRKADKVWHGDPSAFEIAFIQGSKNLRYEDYDLVYLRMPVGDEEFGFFRFQKESTPRPLKDDLFFFSSEIAEGEVRGLYRYVQSAVASRADERERAARHARAEEAAQQRRIEEAKNALIEKALGTAGVPSSLSAPDELLKWKQLLDAGAINQTEYDAKKQQLLGS